MKIKAYLKTDEKGCNFSKDFESQFITDNKGLHPEVLNVPIKRVWRKNIAEPEVLVVDDNGKRIYHKKGNQVSASNLQEFILKQKGLK